jgi:hypothetical protein
MYFKSLTAGPFCFKKMPGGNPVKQLAASSGLQAVWGNTVQARTSRQWCHSTSPVVAHMCQGKFPGPVLAATGCKEHSNDPHLQEPMHNFGSEPSPHTTTPSGTKFDIFAVDNFGRGLAAHHSLIQSQAA